MTPKTPKKPKEDIRKFLKKKGIPSLAKALTKVMPKKHKQRFEHVTIMVDEASNLGDIFRSYEKRGYELITVLNWINSDSYTLFFKRPV